MKLGEGDWFRLLPMEMEQMYLVGFGMIKGFVLYEVK
jgi:hypothetical protein